MLKGARSFVAIVYVMIGVSFLATTGVLFWEFRDAGWLDHLTTHSHLFLFFPTFGIVSLMAFYYPAAVLSDLYWHHLKLGRIRFLLGAVVVAGLAWLIADRLLASPQRSAWEVAPAVLLEDKGEPASCSGAACRRLPVVGAIAGLRSVSQSRLGLGDLVRNCIDDPLFEDAPGPERRRICFASSSPNARPLRLDSDRECCQAQERLRNAVNGYYSDPQKRSLTAQVHAWLLPAKVFFLLNLLVISVLLVLRHNMIVKSYKSALGRVELGLMVGMVAALFFPFMSQAFVQSSGALVGISGRGTFSTITPFLSGAFGLWTLLLVLFFFRRRDKDVELLAKIAGSVATVVAAFKYDVVVSVFVRVANSGADWTTLAVIGAICVIGVVVLIGPWSKAAAREQGDLSKRAADTAAAAARDEAQPRPERP